MSASFTLLRNCVPPRLLPTKQMHFAVIAGSQRWVYLPNSNIAATVIFPSGRMKRRLRSSFSPSCPLAIAEQTVSKEVSWNASPTKPFLTNTFSNLLLKKVLMVFSSKSLIVASRTPASSGEKLPQSVIISASSALSNTLRLSAPFFTYTIPRLSWSGLFTPSLI